MRGLDSIRVRRWVAAGYTIVLTAGIVVPRQALPDVDPLIPHSDKLAHFGAFFIMAWLVARAWGGVGVRLVLIAVACSVYGAFLEVVQGLMPHGDRMFSPADMVANAAGALLVPFLAGAWARHRRGAST